MKIFTLLALFTAFASPAIGGVVSSKQSGKAHCTKNEQDHQVKFAAGSGSQVSKSNQAGSGR
jgi:hypothetical protein